VNTETAARKPHPPMTTHPQRRKRRRNRNRPDPAAITAWPPGTDPRTTKLDASGLGDEVEPLDPTDPDVADLITATGITLDHRGRRIPVTLWRVAAVDHANGKPRDGFSPRVARRRARPACRRPRLRHPRRRRDPRRRSGPARLRRARHRGHRPHPRAAVHQPGHPGQPPGPTRGPGRARIRTLPARLVDLRV